MTASSNAVQHAKITGKDAHIFYSGRCIISTAAVTKRSVTGDAIIILLAGEAEEPRLVCFAEAETGGRDSEAITRRRLALLK